MRVSICSTRLTPRTNVFVTKYVSLQLQLYFLDRFAAVVGNVHVNINVCPADPDLPMEACRQSDNFERCLPSLEPLV